MEEFIQALPKIELHAHLNGSIPDEEIVRLAEEKAGGEGQGEASATMKELKLTDKDPHRTMQECFKLFDLIHSLTDSLAVVRRITLKVVEAYALENTVYLELRTTPRALGGSTPEDYVRTVLGALEESVAIHPRLRTSLVLSINRGNPVADAEDTVRIAKALVAEGNPRMGGIDFSGNPYKGTFADFLPCLDSLRKEKIPITIHFAERPGQHEELKLMLESGPARVGHAVYLTEEEAEGLLERGIPIEACPTSNMATDSVHSLQEHPLKGWVERGHPVCVCTDDRGVFSTSLTKELELALQICDLGGERGMEMLLKLQENALAMAFLTDEEERGRIQGELSEARLQIPRG